MVPTNPVRRDFLQTRNSFYKNNQPKGLSPQIRDRRIFSIRITIIATNRDIVLWIFFP